MCEKVCVGLIQRRTNMNLLMINMISLYFPILECRKKMSTVFVCVAVWVNAMNFPRINFGIGRSSVGMLGVNVCMSAKGEKYCRHSLIAYELGVCWCCSLVELLKSEMLRKYWRVAFLWVALVNKRAALHRHNDICTHSKIEAIRRTLAVSLPLAHT